MRVVKIADQCFRARNYLMQCEVKEKRKTKRLEQNPVRMHAHEFHAFDHPVILCERGDKNHCKAWDERCSYFRLFLFHACGEEECSPLSPRCLWIRFGPQNNRVKWLPLSYLLPVNRWAFSNDRLLNKRAPNAIVFWDRTRNQIQCCKSRRKKQT